MRQDGAAPVAQVGAARADNPLVGDPHRAPPNRACALTQTLTPALAITFNQPDSLLGQHIGALRDDALDALPFGVIGIEGCGLLLTLRMRPVKVKPHLLAVPGQALRHVLVQRPV